jgi:hypothetical protein
MALARYDAVADFYANGFDSTDDSVSVALLDLLGPVAGRHVLDVACGHGRLLRRHNLWLEQIVEPLPAPDWDQAHDADRKPVYLAARSVKVIEN